MADKLWQAMQGPEDSVWRRSRSAMLFWLVLVGGIASLTAVADILRDMRAGQTPVVWRPAVREAVSAMLILAVIPLIAWLDATLKKRCRGLWAQAAAHSGVALAMSVFRPFALSVIYVAPALLAGGRYNWSFILSRVPGEMPKELLVYALILALMRYAPGTTIPRPRQKRHDPAPFVIRDGARTHYVPVADIECIRAAGNYVEVSTPSGGFLHRATLHDTAHNLPADHFMKVQRSCIINLAHINLIEPDGVRDHVAILRSGARIRLARGIRPALEAAISTQRPGADPR